MSIVALVAECLEVSLALTKSMPLSPPASSPKVRTSIASRISDNRFQGCLSLVNNLRTCSGARSFRYGSGNFSAIGSEGSPNSRQLL